MNASGNSEAGWQLRRIPLAAITVDPAIQQRAAGTSPAAGGAADRRRTVRRGGRRYRMNTARIGRGRSAPGRRKKVAPKPKLSSLAWSEADAAERARFIEAVGRRSLEEAIAASHPVDEMATIERAFDRLETVLRAASEPVRRSSLEHRRAQIMALAHALEPSFAAAPSSADTRWANGGLDGNG